jgi:hypothetical protein
MTASKRSETYYHRRPLGKRLWSIIIEPWSRLKLGDWAGFGGELDQLRAVLEAAGSRDEPWGLLPLPSMRRASR